MSTWTAFDSDVLIYAADFRNVRGTPIRALFEDTPVDGFVGFGSVLLLTETLSKPLRTDPGSVEAASLFEMLSRLDLRPLDEPTARTALALAVTYGLRAADAAHLATAIEAGADRFLTNNRKDFPKTIAEIDIVYPEDLA
ncbi:MAG: PIN domain-containing protein [Tessaracoccus sp.]|uniref:type II toxin-antitoxin system VapC family toxin n=1 Tax=Tessaracoccus sp. TaxID=1971211 RepID=UPI001EBE728A|nr:PIN domain-containing protein [Tessaracoccus sp.]MBK7821586.1 PIN domain-containing protein [Tessaracoccus sp.]